MHAAQLPAVRQELSLWIGGCLVPPSIASPWVSPCLPFVARDRRPLGVCVCEVCVCVIGYRFPPFAELCSGCALKPPRACLCLADFLLGAVRPLALPACFAGLLGRRASSAQPPSWSLLLLGALSGAGRGPGVLRHSSTLELPSVLWLAGGSASRTLPRGPFPSIRCGLALGSSILGGSIQHGRGQPDCGRSRKPPRALGVPPPAPTPSCPSVQALSLSARLARNLAFGTS